MMNKEQEIYKYSNPQEVIRKAKKLMGDDVVIKLSTRKNKKYMIKNIYNDKWIHFGQMGYEDFTKHKDYKRQRLFKNRNADWVDYPLYSPAFLSYWLLW